MEKNDGNTTDTQQDRETRLNRLLEQISARPERLSSPARMLAIEVDGEVVKVTISKGDETQEVEADQVMVATGFKANSFANQTSNTGPFGPASRNPLPLSAAETFFRDLRDSRTPALLPT